MCWARARRAPVEDGRAQARRPLSGELRAFSLLSEPRRSPKAGGAAAWRIDGQRPTRRQRQRLISTHGCGILTERPLRLAFGVFCGRDAPSVADLLYHDEGTTSSVLRTVRTSDIVPRLAASAATWRRRRASLSPLFGWGCSSYRRTWGCVKCGAASAASWRSRVAARHCYYGPPVSICCEF